MIAIETTETVEGVEGIRPVWESFQDHPNADIDFYLAIIACRRNVIAPFAAILKREGRPVAMIVGRIENVDVELRIGYHVVRRFGARSLSIIQGGLLGVIGTEEAKVLLQHVKGMLREKKVEVVNFSHIVMGTELQKALRKEASFFQRSVFLNAQTHRKMALPESSSTLLQETKARHKKWLANIRRCRRAIEEELGAECLLLEYSTEQDVDQLIHDAEAVACQGYQRALHVGFEANPENWKRLKLEAHRGNLRSSVMYVGQKPVAFWIGSVYKGTYYSDFMSYAPETRRFQPGNIVFQHVVERLCDEGIRSLDFGLGDAFYKKRFADKSWDEISILLFAPSPKWIAICLLCNCVAILEHVGRFLLEEARLTQKLKTSWKRRASSTLARDSELPLSR